MGRKFLFSQWVFLVCAALALTGCETMKQTFGDMDVDPDYQQAMDLSDYESEPAITATRLGVPKAKAEAMYGKKKGSMKHAKSDKGSMKKSASSKWGKGKAMSGFNTASIAYPTGRRDSSVLLLTKKTPKVVRKGDAYNYTIEVTNITDLQLQDVNVSEIIPEGFQLTSVTPKETSKNGDNLNWDFGSLKPGETRAITLTGKATATDELPCCTSASYDNPALCANSGVIQPALDVAVNVPAAKTTSVICDTVPVEYTVKNSGDSHLSGVVVEGQLPAGITATNGDSTVAARIGDLAPGQTRTFTKMVKASKTGTYSFKAAAQDNSGVSATSNVATAKVTQPQIDVTASADRGKQFVGRDVAFTVTARNTGSIATTNTEVFATVPSGSSFKGADNGGALTGGGVRWNVGTLAPGASKKVTFDVTANRGGELQTDVNAKAYCCQDNAMAKSSIEGIPALLLEVVDIVDPIEVGGNQTYEITVTNQGSADANNVAVEANLEGMSYISASGATPATASGRRISLQSIPRIPAKDRVSWRVTAKAEETGDKRFSVKMTSSELGRPVEETESTFIY